MNENDKHVVMVASENGALSGGKIGGVGDVIRDLPAALAKLGWRVTILIPSYGFLHRHNPSRFLQKLDFPFRNKPSVGELWRVNPVSPETGITHLLFEHHDLKGNPVYFNDPPNTPFLRDATKYALFCSAAGKFLETLEPPFVLHLHDWHAATLLLLAELHPEFSHLKDNHTVFSIHNLSIQGTRPMLDHPSSLENWFPELFKKTGWISHWKDPRYPDPCYTPMAVGIRFADKVNTVSPTYAEEILQPSNHRVGVYRGEGLENLLQNASAGKRLFGILNGCEYNDARVKKQLPFADLAAKIIEEIERNPLVHNEEILDESVFRLRHFSKINPGIILTTVTRIVEQKVRLFFEKGTRGTIVLDHLMRMLEARNGVFIILGTGTSEYEANLLKYFDEHRRIIFINGYYERISSLLYENGNLFLMPSLFEPCGISQMVAMREGQPCVVHEVGGLKDTVKDMVNGFSFRGESLTDTAENFIGALENAMFIYENDKTLWERIRCEAVNSRFTWVDSAMQYTDLLYTS
ncbi:MAG: glycogen synthase [Bacteroidota bacterium]